MVRNDVKKSSSVPNGSLLLFEVVWLFSLCWVVGTCICSHQHVNGKLLNCGLIPRPWVVLCPDPPKSGKRVWCYEWLFLSHGAGSNGVKNVIIAFPMYCMISCSITTSLHIIAHSAIWFKLSDRGAMTWKVAQNTRPSLSHMRRGSWVRDVPMRHYAVCLKTRGYLTISTNRLLAQFPGLLL